MTNVNTNILLWEGTKKEKKNKQNKQKPHTLVKLTSSKCSSLIDKKILKIPKG